MRQEWVDRLLDAYEKILREHECLGQILLFRSESAPQEMSG
jgi:hypothetical protein